MTGPEGNPADREALERVAAIERNDDLPDDVAELGRTGGPDVQASAPTSEAAEGRTQDEPRAEGGKLPNHTPKQNSGQGEEYLSKSLDVAAQAQSLAADAGLDKPAHKGRGG